MFNVGDRVMYVGTVIPSRYGCYGTVVCVLQLSFCHIDYDDGDHTVVHASNLRIVGGDGTLNIASARIGDDEPATNGDEFEARMLRLWEM